METVLDTAKGTDDAALVARAKTGDAAAFAALVERHMRRAYAAALGLVGSHEDALDLSQEAFARAYRAKATLDPGRPFYAWLYAVLRRLCFNHLRDRGTRRRRIDEERDWLVADAEARAEEESPERRAAASELRGRITAAIEDLPDTEREAIVLKEFEGLKYREIAELLDVPVGTVMSRLFSARRRLARALEEVR